jgi:hypothetical protein
MTTAQLPPWKVWTGRVMSALPAAMMVLSGSMKLAHVQAVIEGWVGKFGFPESLLTPIGLIELACVAIYLIPRTAVLGAILMSGYLAAAFCTHLRVQDVASYLPPILFGVFAWGGLYLRDERIRALLPLVSKSSG